MDVGHVIPEAIRDLLEKRGTFQEWLKRLDELGSDFRPEVTSKVRSDYASRLREVENELEGHRAELEAALDGRTGAVEELAAQHDARSAELEETQLRHVVGEFDDAEWESRRAEHQVQIDELEAELTAQRSAVDSLQTVLSELTGKAAAVALPAAIDAGGPPRDESSVAREPAWMTQPLDEVADDSLEVEAEEAHEPEPAEGVMAESDQEVAVVDEVEEVREDEAPEPVEAIEERVETEADPDAADTGEFMDELEFLESLSLDDADSFDAVSAMLDEEEGDADEGSKRETGDS